MQITDIRFSYATPEREPGNRAGFFSVQFDNTFIVHHFSLISKGKGDYRVALPILGENKGNHGKSYPVIWFSDRKMYSQLTAIAIEMHRQLIKKYGRYDFKTSGGHDKVVNVKTAKRDIQIAKDRQKRLSVAGE